MIRSFLRDLINDHKPTKESKNEEDKVGNDSDAERGE